MDADFSVEETTADATGYGVIVLIPLALLGLLLVIVACSAIGTVFEGHGIVAAAVISASVLGLWLLDRKKKAAV